MISLDEEPVGIEGPVRLEGRLHRPAQARGGLVLAHPHPLYGGSMDNNVVAALARAGAGLGLAALRFNFRGVGLSEGAYDDGRGEGLDILAALDHLAGLGLTRLFLAAYSFGAWVAAGTDFGSRPLAGSIWVAPPVGLLAIETAKVRLRPGLILAGGRDAFCPAADLDRLLRGLGPGVRVERLAGADHFFGGSEDWLRDRAADYLGRLVSAQP